MVNRVGSSSSLLPCILFFTCSIFSFGCEIEIGKKKPSQWDRGIQCKDSDVKIVHRDCQCAASSYGTDVRSWSTSNVSCSKSNFAEYCFSDIKEKSRKVECRTKKSAKNLGLGLFVNAAFAGQDSAKESKTSMSIDHDDSLKSKYTCPVECQLNDTANCRKINLGATTFSAEFKKLTELFIASKNTLPIADVLRTFDMASDPCKRSDLYFSKGGFINSGMRCKADFNIGFGPFETGAVSISIPEQLNGNIERTSELINKIQFSQKSTSMRLSLIDDFDGDFGGHIISIEKVNRTTFIETEQVCIAL